MARTEPEIHDELVEARRVGELPDRPQRLLAVARGDVAARRVHVLCDDRVAHGERVVGGAAGRRELEPAEVEGAEPVAVAQAARDRLDQDFILNARTDVFAIEGLDEAIRRCLAVDPLAILLGHDVGKGCRIELIALADDVVRFLLAELERRIEVFQRDVDVAWADLDGDARQDLVVVGMFGQGVGDGRPPAGRRPGVGGDEVLATAILATSRPDLRHALRAFRDEVERLERATPPKSG